MNSFAGQPASVVRLDPGTERARFKTLFLFSRHKKCHPISDCDFAGRFPPVSACHLPFSRSVCLLQNSPRQRADRFHMSSMHCRAESQFSTGEMHDPPENQSKFASAENRHV